MKFLWLFFFLLAAISGCGVSNQGSLFSNITDLQNQNNTTSSGTTSATTQGGSGSGSGNGTGGFTYNLELKSKVDVLTTGYQCQGASSNNANDVWGYEDTVNGVVTRIGMVGTNCKTSFIDVTDPANPIHLADVPGMPGTPKVWRDMKVYKQYAYIVSEVSKHGLQIFDLHRLRNINRQDNDLPKILTQDVHYNGFGNAHNIAIDEESGFAYVIGATENSTISSTFVTCNGSLLILDINNPLAPVFKGCFKSGYYSSDTTRVASNAYVPHHDDGGHDGGGHPPASTPTPEPTATELPTGCDDLVDPSQLHEETQRLLEWQALNFTNPTAARAMHPEPSETLGCGRFYTHDAQCVVYKGPDADYIGKRICFVFNGPFYSTEQGKNNVVIVDVDNLPSTPTESLPHSRMIYKITYANPGYTHQGWITPDQKYLLIDDELDEIQAKVNKTRTIVFNIQDLDNPVFVTNYLHPYNSTDHNLYIRDNLAYFSNYNSGLVVADISQIAQGQIQHLTRIDNVPSIDTPGFAQGGTWSNFPFFKKVADLRTIIFSDMHQPDGKGGLWIATEQITP